mmetsp:Transcript_100872/g.323764  ORF Transcript_100872/g.323764 Transcript_100872/m.323764 type:complete len:213 (-) Transcript_100872:90-728(-)
MTPRSCDELRITSESEASTTPESAMGGFHMLKQQSTETTKCTDTATARSSGGYVTGSLVRTIAAVSLGASSTATTLQTDAAAKPKLSCRTSSGRHGGRPRAAAAREEAAPEIRGTAARACKTPIALCVTRQGLYVAKAPIAHAAQTPAVATPATSYARARRGEVVELGVAEDGTAGDATETKRGGLAKAAPRGVYHPAHAGANRATDEEAAV